MSPKQAILFDAFRKRQTLTLAECVELVGKDIYCNEAKHVGTIIKRMINRGWIERVKPGVFKLLDSHAQRNAATGQLPADEVMPAMREWARKHGIIN